MSNVSIKTKHKCPKCGCSEMGNGKGHLMFCKGCGEKSKAVDCLPQRKVRKDRCKAIAAAKHHRKNKFLTRQSAILKNCQTVTEGEFGKRLTAAKIEFIPQWTYNIQGFAGIVDFYLPQYKLVLEVDGGYHLEADQKLKDMEKDFICRTLLHKKVLRMTNKQALSLQMGEILSLIKTAN